MISIRVNEIFNYLSTDRKKDKTRTYSSVVENDSKEKRKDSRPSANAGHVTPHRGECGAKKNGGGCVQPTSGSDSTGKNSPTDCMSGDFFAEALETGDCETFVGHSAFRNVQISSPFPELKHTNTACKSVTASASSRNSNQLKVSASDVSTCIASQRRKPLKPTAASSTTASSTETSASATGSCKMDNKTAAAASSKLTSDIPEKRAAATAHREPVGFTAAPASGGGSAKSRKKRNRRNGDRCASAATLDFRSAEKSAALPAALDRYISGNKSFSAVVEGRKISAGQAGDCADKIMSTQMQQEAVELCCEGQKVLTDGEHVAEHEVALLPPSPLTTSCFGRSRGDELTTCEMLPVVCKLDVSKSSVARVRTVSGMDDLDTFDQDLVGFVPSIPAVVGILDPHKIDALDDFEDLLPSSCSSIHLETFLPQEGHEWTAVNRRCKKVVVSADVVGPLLGCQSLKIDEIARSTAAHIELDQHADKVTVIIRGSAEQIHAASNLVLALTSSQPSPAAAADVSERSRKKKNRNRGGSRSKKATSAALLGGPLPAAKVVADRQLRAAAAAVASAAATSPPKCVSVGTETDFVSPCKEVVRENRNRPPAMEDVESEAVKEYSLFDNHFSRSVELVMRRDSPLYVGNCGQLAARAADALPSRPAADLALLAKAPGYRTTNTSSPISAGAMYEIVRKNSDASSSSSSISSCGRSAEEVVWGSSSPVVSGPIYRPLPANFVLERPRSTPQQRLYGRNSPPAAAYQSFPLENGRAAQQESFLRNSRACDYVDLRQSLEEQYSSQHQPMTLPRIETDLNPNAPDFVYRPVSSDRISKPLFSSSCLANGSIAMPSSSPTSYLSGRYAAAAARDVDYWSFAGDGFGVGSSGIGDLLSAASGADAMASSPYGKFLPSTPINIRHQWASPGVCQESVTFG